MPILDPQALVFSLRNALNETRLPSIATTTPNSTKNAIMPADMNAAWGTLAATTR